VLHETRPVPQLFPSRDVRGRLTLTDATHVTALVGGMRCEGSWNPDFALDCRENGNQQWPMGSFTWQLDPSRNYFSGRVSFSNSLETKFPPFYSAAAPPGSLTGQNASRWVVAGLDGDAQLLGRAAEPALSFAGWGSEFVSVASACNAAWQVLATGPQDWTQADWIQLYEIDSRRAVAVGQPLSVPGPVLALWSFDDGRSARMISRNLQTGMYEASMVSISCGN